MELVWFGKWQNHFDGMNKQTHFFVLLGDDMIIMNTLLISHLLPGIRLYASTNFWCRMVLVIAFGLEGTRTLLPAHIRQNNFEAFLSRAMNNLRSWVNRLLSTTADRMQEKILVCKEQSCFVRLSLNMMHVGVAFHCAADSKHVQKSGPTAFGYPNILSSYNFTVRRYNAFALELSRSIYYSLLGSRL